MINLFKLAENEEKNHHFVSISFFFFYFALYQYRLKVCQVNAVLQNIENSKVQLNVLDDIANKENAQIQKDKQKDQNDTKHEDKMVYDLNESLRHTEQQLQQVVSSTKHLMDFHGK